MPDSIPPSPLNPQRLWDKIQLRTHHALACGALQSIPTVIEQVEQAGVRFLVRLLTQLDRKEKAKQAQVLQSKATGTFVNPFLPYDPDLFVADLSDTHLCLLNKFNVVDHHLLIVTRAFAEQEEWLTLADFQALWTCMQEVDGLAFYNGGASAGASQPHKHLQLVPLPIVPTGDRLPIETWVHKATFDSGVGVSAGLPFVHAIANLASDSDTTSLDYPDRLLRTYHRLLAAVGLEVSGEYQTGAYNLLVTRQWMMVVPRSQESYQAISVNSLGFAGSLLVKNAEQMTLLKTLGPMHLLQQVGWSRFPNKT